MFKLLGDIVTVDAKTAVGLPVAAAVDIVTLGGELTDKRGRTHTGDMLKGIEESIKEIAND